jgi:hypothetical protein
MPKITPKSLSLHVDGKSVELHSDTSKVFEMNKALANSAGFKDFANDPKAFAAKYGLGIDQQVSHQLKGKLTGVGSLGELTAMQGSGDGGNGATVWAVAGGAYSISSSKIAIAF